MFVAASTLERMEESPTDITIEITKRIAAARKRCHAA